MEFTVSRFSDFAALTAAGLATALLVTPASAATYTADELLRQYNIITFDGLTLHDEVEGRALVGGGLVMANAAQLMFDKTANQAGFADESIITGNITGATLNVQNGSNITVGGNVSNSTLELNGQGTALIGGTLSANANQGTKRTNQWAADPGFGDRFPQDVAATFTATSDRLAALGGGQATVNGNQLVFGQTPTNGRSVYSIGFATLAAASEFKFDLNGADTVIINVTGTSGTIAANFVTGDTGFEDLADRVIWNFTDATTVDLDRQMWGFLLAPLAHFNGANTNFEGTVVARTATTHGEMHSQQWRGTLPGPVPAPVPVPAALPLLAAGLAGLALLRRRRSEVPEA